MKAFSTLLKLKDSDKFKWCEEHQDALTQIKVSLTAPHVLVPPCRGKPLKLHISALKNPLLVFLHKTMTQGGEQAIFFISAEILTRLR